VVDNIPNHELRELWLFDLIYLYGEKSDLVGLIYDNKLRSNKLSGLSVFLHKLIVYKIPMSKQLQSLRANCVKKIDHAVKVQRKKRMLLIQSLEMSVLKIHDMLIAETFKSQIKVHSA